jgi:hypothetical protein
METSLPIIEAAPFLTVAVLLCISLGGLWGLFFWLLCGRCWRAFWFRCLNVMGAIFLLGTLFAVLPLKLADQLVPYRYNPPATEIQRAFHTTEHGKVIEEIKMRIQQGDDWFHKKFLVIGSLVAVIVGALAVDIFNARGETKGSSPAGEDDETFDETRKPERLLSKLFAANSTCSVLALATVIAVTIDLHNALSETTVQQLGLWLHHHVEPVFLGVPEAGGRPLILGWEQFLRRPGISMHTDALSKLLFHPHGNLFTWTIYALYLGCFQKVAIRTESWSIKRDDKGIDEPQPSPSQQRIALAGFFFVHFSLLTYTVIGHGAPGAFYYSIGQVRINGAYSGFLFILPWLMLFALHGPYWARLWRGSFMK